MKRNHQAAIVLGNLIRETRMTLRLSQEELAFRANLDRAFLSRLENGMRSPSFDTLLSVTAALDLNLTQLSQRFEQRMREHSEKDQPDQST